MTAAPTSFTPDEFLAWAEKAERRFTGLAITAAPVLGLLPSAIVTAVHCYTYLNFGPVGAPLTGAGVEAVSIAIVATRVLLAGKGLVHREKELDRAFIGYLSVLATVNAGLNIAHGFTAGWTPLLFGAMLAEFALGALPVPVAWLVATRNEIAMLDRAALIADDKADVQRAIARAEKMEDEERSVTAQIAIIAAQSEAERALLRDKADIAAAKRKERPVTAKVAPAIEPLPVVAIIKNPLRPCKFGCGKMVAGTPGQNAHSDKCPKNISGAEAATK